MVLFSYFWYFLIICLYFFCVLFCTFWSFLVLVATSCYFFLLLATTLFLFCNFLAILGHFGYFLLLFGSFRYFWEYLAAFEWNLPSFDWNLYWIVYLDFQILLKEFGNDCHVPCYDIEPFCAHFYGNFLYTSLCLHSSMAAISHNATQSLLNYHSRPPIQCYQLREGTKKMQP